MPQSECQAFRSCHRRPHTRILLLYQTLCRKAFAAIHGIGMKKVKILLNKKKESPTSTPVPDKRGHHPSALAISGVRLERVRQHICALPVTASHYSQLHTAYRWYLDEPGGSIGALYTRYLTWMDEHYPDEEKVKEQFYRTVFTRDYNIVFEPPKTDVCTTCEKLATEIKNKEQEGIDVGHLKLQL